MARNRSNSGGANPAWKGGIRSTLAWLLMLGLVHAATAAPVKGDRLSLETSELKFRLSARTPNQIAAFYEGRGFPPDAITQLKTACFFTISITNKRQGVTRLRPADWRIVDAKGNSIQRLGQPYWDSVWQTHSLPAASRATLRWTMLPEQRDLLPDEGVGGNLVLGRVAGPIKLTPRFKLESGADGVLVLKTLTIECGKDQ